MKSEIYNVFPKLKEMLFFWAFYSLKNPENLYQILEK